MIPVADEETNRCLGTALWKRCLMGVKISNTRSREWAIASRGAG